MKTLIKGGRVCLEDKICLVDILIVGEKIVEIGNLSHEVCANVDQVIDAQKLLVLPGAIDLHVHVDDQIGDYYLTDTYKSASETAIKNGITTFVSFITQAKNTKLSTSIQIAENKAKNNCFCDYLWHLTPTTWDDESWEDIFAAFARGHKSLKLYTTYKPAGIYSSYSEIATILRRVRSFNVTTLIHSEDDFLLDQTFNNKSYDLHNAYTLSLLRPKLAEITAIEKVIEIAKSTESKVHIVHVSTPEGAEKIYQAKKDLAITCETCPQYLFTNDTMLQGEGGYRYTCTPPLRDPESQTQLQQLAKNGYFDVYATDHCPFAKKAKDTFKHGGDILTVPKGMPGIGALMPMTYKLHEEQGDAGIVTLMQKLAMNPAKIAGIFPRKGVIRIGSDADLIILDPNGKSRKIYSLLGDAYDPFANFNTNLVSKYILLRGKIMVKNNKILSIDNSGGIFIC